MTYSSWGRAIGIEVKSTNPLVDSTFVVDSSKIFNAGRAVTLDPTTGKLIPVESNVKPLGLCKFNKNLYIDETQGAFGMYGSTQGTVVIQGIVNVMPNYFKKADGSEERIDNFTADLESAAPMSPIYVVTAAGNDLGKLTSVLVESGVGQNDKTKIGYLLVAPSAAVPIAKILLLA